VKNIGLLVSLVLLTISAKATPQKMPDGPVVRIAAGSVRGYMDGGTAVFKGIPYAAPPLRDLRWREPQPAASWTGVREAVQFANACTQDSAGVDRFLSFQAAAYNAPFEKQPVVSSEDCLYLNLWIPDWAAHQNLPVMVFFHGGSNVVGNAGEPGYDGKALASHGVIIASVNYRLGVIGFLAHPALTAESPHHSSGNYGLLDQMFALSWIKQNIAQFGGDPSRATVFGESAGAVDIGTLIASPLSTGLFQRAISESGPAFGLGPARTLAQGEQVGVAISTAAQSASLSQLRQMPATQLLQITGQVLKDQFPGVNVGTPLIDHWVLPENPAKAYATGHIQRVDLMIGLNQREFSAFRIIAEAAAKNNPAQKSGTDNALKNMAAAADPLYGGWTYVALGTYLAQALPHRDAAIDAATTDMLAGCPVGATASLVSVAGQKVFVYRFDRTVPGPGESNLGAFHSLELPYVFGAFQSREWTWLKFTGVDYQLSTKMQTYWTQFAKTGNPNATGLPNWPEWSYPKESYLDFGQTGDVMPSESFSPRFCRLAPDRLKEQLSE
jgi:para-nitrobenzyl esterase